MEEFLRLTKYLKNTVVEDMYERYFNGRKFDRKNYKDFEQMKEEATPIFEMFEQWSEDANRIVHQLPIFPNQIKNTEDNLEIMLLHSYFHDVRKKRFLELYNSVIYNFDLILNQNNKE